MFARLWGLALEISLHLWLWEILRRAFLHSLPLAECHWYSRKDLKNITKVFFNTPLGLKGLNLHGPFDTLWSLANGNYQQVVQTVHFVSACEQLESHKSCEFDMGLTNLTIFFFRVVWLSIYVIVFILETTQFLIFYSLHLDSRQNHELSTTTRAGGCICIMHQPK